MSAPSPLRFSASTKGFYNVDFHGEDIPADAVRITHARHGALLAGQATGRAIFGDETGMPKLAPLRAPTTAQLLALAIGAIKGEASRRILAIASLAAQANDSAAIAILAFGLATASDTTLAAGHAALARRARIDAIRNASNGIEAMITLWAAAALKTFDAAADALWPTGE